MIKNYLEQLRVQRWDDHRFYHHSRINQSLHFVSAISFMIGYVMMFFDPLMSALIGGLLFRTVHLFFIYNVETGLVWMTKIITDPFNDFMLYRKAPIALLRGEL